MPLLTPGARPLPPATIPRRAPWTREQGWVLLGWAAVLGPGGLADILLAPPHHRAGSAMALAALVSLVASVALVRPRWLAPLTAVLGLAMALADPFTAGPLPWRATLVVADLGLAALGVWAWRRSGRALATRLPVGAASAWSALIGALTFTLAAQLFVLAVHYATGLSRVVPLARTVEYLVDPLRLATGPALPGLLLSLGAGLLAGSMAWAASCCAVPGVRAAGLGGLGSVGGMAAAVLAVCCSPVMGVLIGSAAAGAVLLAYQERSLVLAAAIALQAAGILVVLRAARRAGRRAEPLPPAAPAGYPKRAIVVLAAANVIALAALLATAAQPVVSSGAPAAPAPPPDAGAMLVHVLDAHRRPLPGAVVVAIGPASIAGVTAADGTLSLPGLSPGSYRVTAGRDATTTELRVEVEAGRTAHVFVVLGP